VYRRDLCAAVHWRDIVGRETRGTTLGSSPGRRRIPATRRAVASSACPAS